MKKIFIPILFICGIVHAQSGQSFVYTVPTPSTLFSESFTSGYSNWVLTNTGSTEGLTFAVSGGLATWTAAHTATVTQTVANNNIVTNNAFAGNYLTLIINHQWTDPTPTNTQYEIGFWWDSNNRIYYGNNSADNLSFFNIKIAGINVYSDVTTLPQSNNCFMKIVLDRSNNRCSIYRWVSSTWVAYIENIDTSGYSIPSSSVNLFFGAGAESIARLGGDTGSCSFMYLYNGLTNIDPTSL